ELFLNKIIGNDRNRLLQQPYQSIRFDKRIYLTKLNSKLDQFCNFYFRNKNTDVSVNYFLLLGNFLKLISTR
ncbi:hypothetical protein BpHYR1_041130, partial [Brachionus plicatilis]